jgi:hypothetical protein
MRNVTRRRVLWALLAVLCLLSLRWSASGQQNAGSGIQVNATSIGGTVVNSAGAKPEAGVWVIAETKLGSIEHIQIRPNPLAN